MTRDVRWIVRSSIGENVRIDTGDYNSESGMSYSGPPRRRKRKVSAEIGAMLAPELNRQQSEALGIKHATYREDIERREERQETLRFLGRLRACARPR